MLPYLHFAGRTIPLYGVCMALGILISSSIAFFRVKRCGGDGNSLLIIAACAVGCGLAGAKMLYLFVSYGIRQALAQALSGDFAFLAEGGQVFYGGLIGGIAGGFLGARIAGEQPALYCDAIIPCLPLGHAFGRLGCFFAGCCGGLPYDGMLSVRFPGAAQSIFPVQLLELLFNLLLFVGLSLYMRKKRPAYRALYLYLLLYSVLRFALEFLRGDSIRGMAFGLSTSQWISLLLFASAALLLLFQILRQKKRKIQLPVQ